MYKGFSTVELQRPRRSTFDLSHFKRGSTGIGRLIPILTQECIPSDVFRGGSEVMIRVAPLLAPIFDTIKCYIHYFFVPNRLLWEEWETFITGGRLGVGIDPLVAPIPPRIDIGLAMGADPSIFGNRPDDVSQYLGIPPLSSSGSAAEYTGKHLDMMPAIAYQCIWYNYYRDRNFISDEYFDDLGVDMPVPSGTQTWGQVADYFKTKARNWRHDYFSSALPFTQRGEEVLMPISLGGEAPLYVNPPTSSPATATISGVTNPGAVTYQGAVAIDEDLPTSPSAFWVKGEDFDGTSTSINDFRSAYALQVWLERNAIGGSRYNESTQAHFGVKPQDSRLQRPEYIGGGVVDVKISEVVSTAWATNDTDNAIPQASMAGHGIAYGNKNRFNYFCAEHGFIMGILSVMPEPSYFQGLPRMFKRGSFLDYPWPTFAKLGEQEVADYEIFADPAALTPGSDGEYPDFGYQSRYADWKSAYSTSFGLFRDEMSNWTLTRIFAGPPVLGTSFNQISEDIDQRIFAVQGLSDNYWLYIHNSVTVKRALPYFGTPNTLGFGS